jgi:SAM-dependent methyltransferase
VTVVPLGTSYTEVFTSALRGEPCEVVGLGAVPQPLPVTAWNGPVGSGDLAVLAHCRGATLDIGCGPGRMTRALAESGHAVLGIDVVPEAVAMTRSRGGVALVQDVFGPLPGEGRWATALLADGNIGIGGDPRTLLARVHDLLTPGGRVVVDLWAPGHGVRSALVRLQTPGLHSRPFRWAVVGADAIGPLAASAGLVVHGLHVHGTRWFAVLEKVR